MDDSSSGDCSLNMVIRLDNGGVAEEESSPAAAFAAAALNLASKLLPISFYMDFSSSGVSLLIMPRSFDMSDFADFSSPFAASSVTFAAAALNLASALMVEESSSGDFSTNMVMRLDMDGVPPPNAASIAAFFAAA